MPDCQDTRKQTALAKRQIYPDIFFKKPIVLGLILTTFFKAKTGDTRGFPLRSTASKSAIFPVAAPGRSSARPDPKNREPAYTILQHGPPEFQTFD